MRRISDAMRSTLPARSVISSALLFAWAIMCACCGISGLKPTYGRVSRYGQIAFGSSLDCPGPVARDVTDTALMLNIIAGPDPRDGTAANNPVPDYTVVLDCDIQGMRIGLSPDYFRIISPGGNRLRSRRRGGPCCSP